MQTYFTSCSLIYHRVDPVTRQYSCTRASMCSYYTQPMGIVYSMGFMHQDIHAELHKLYKNGTKNMTR